MSDFTQVAHSLLTHAALTHPANIIGTPQSVASYLSGDIYVWVANVEVTANAAGAGVFILGTYNGSDDEDWHVLREFLGTTTAAETEAMTATEPVGETVMAVASTTNLVVGGTIYLQDVGAIGDGEWAQIVAVVTNTSVTLMHGLGTEKDNSDFIWSQAERFHHHISNAGGLSRVAVVIVHQAATGSNLHVKAESLWASDIE